jgi:hypothetical protein
MYLLDTNVISELRKAKSGKADKNVVAWANNVSATRLFLSVITILEIEIGVLLVERRDPSQGAVLRSWLNAHVLPAFLLSAFFLLILPSHNVAPDFMFLTAVQIATPSSQLPHLFME